MGTPTRGHPEIGLPECRQRLNQAYNMLAVPVPEQETFISKSLQKTLKGNVKKSLTALKEEQKAVEHQIQELIQADARLKELFDLMVSVPGVGPVIATELLMATNEMETINEPKKLACHAGVAPFEYRSGSSIRGKTKVSHQARKRLKALIHLGTMSAIQVKAGRPVPRPSGLLRTQTQGRQAADAGHRRCPQQAHPPRLRRCAPGPKI